MIPRSQRFGRPKRRLRRARGGFGLGWYLSLKRGADFLGEEGPVAIFHRIERVDAFARPLKVPYIHC